MITSDSARLLIERAETASAETLKEATQVLASTDLADDLRPLIQRAAGIAAREVGNFDLARHWLGLSSTNIQQSNNDRGRSLLALAGVAAIVGDSEQSLADISAAEECFVGVDLAYPISQRAGVLHQFGRIAEATMDYKQGIDLAVEGGFTILEAANRSNYGLLLALTADYAEAELQLGKAVDLYSGKGHTNRLLNVEHNLGYVALCRGRIVDALRHFEAERVAAVASGLGQFRSSADRCEALMMAGLTDEAEVEACAAARHFTATGSKVAARDAYISAGRAALESGDANLSAGHLTAALELFEPVGVTPWRSVAEVLLALAELLAHGAATAPKKLDACVQVLRDASMTDEALIAELVAARHFIRAGDQVESQRRLAAVGPVSRVPRRIRSQWWLAVGEHRERQQHRASAQRAFDAGLAANQQLRQQLLTIETAGSVGVTGRALATGGLRSTLASKRMNPQRVLHWFEALDGGAPTHLAFDDSPTAAAHRAASLALAESLRSATSGQSIDDGATAAAAIALSNAERAHQMFRRLRVGQRSRGRPDTETPRSISDLINELDVDLLYLGELDDELIPVSVIDRVPKLHDPIDRLSVARDIAGLRSRLRSFWSSGGSAKDQQLLSRIADRLDRQLIPERMRTHDGPVLIIGSTGLGVLPWGLLPSLRSRSVRITASLRRYLRATSSATQNQKQEGLDRVLMVAGPGLEAATHEVTKASSSYPRAQTLSGRNASVGAVLAALPVDLVHLACHGSVRDDNPAFSSLQMADGPMPLTMFEGQTPARLVVLSACDIGRPAQRSQVHTIDLANMLLDLGVGSVIAASIAVPDGTTAEVMIDFHRRLASGTSPADALLHLRTARDPLVSTVASVFSCHGAG